MVIAKELGYSETVFVFDSRKADFKLQYFTPTEEVPLCGHATIATFFVLRLLNMLDRQNYTIETKAGLLHIQVQEDGLIFMEQNCPAYFDILRPDVFTGCIEKDFIECNLPIQIVSTGLKDIMLPIDSKAHLEELSEMRESFKDLIKAYEDYNSESVAKHKNSDDLYSEAMAKISAPNAVNVSAAVKKAQEQTVASQTIGKVTHTDEEEAQQKQDYQELFDKLISNKESAGSIFDDMKNVLVNYASGGSNNSAVLDLLNSRNSNSFSNMLNYWSKLLSV